MPLTCQGDAVAESRQAKTRVDGDSGALGQSYAAAEGTRACHYCGPCERGCQSRSYFNSAFTTVADAVKSGNCTLISNAMAYKVLMDQNSNKARGVLMWIAIRRSNTKSVLAPLFCARRRRSRCAFC